MEAPYGSWKSPITSEMIVSSAVGIGSPVRSGGANYWTESRPVEAGRNVIVRDGVDVTPAGFYVRTLVHEYGGGSWIVNGNTVWFSNLFDQKVYRQEVGSEPVPITETARFADFCLSPDERWLACIRETHGEGEAVNEVVAVPSDGQGEIRVLASGHDFFSTPRFSPDGTLLVWLSWDHPNMPWDGTSLWSASVGDDLFLADVRLVAGGESESIFQPEFSPSGVLHYISDKTNWWNLYRSDGTALCPMEAEFGVPQWGFATRTYDFLPDDRIVCRWSSEGRARLGILDDGKLSEIDQPYTSVGSPSLDGSCLLFVGSTERSESAIVSMDLDSGGAPVVVKIARELSVPADYISTAEPIEFPTTGGLTAHAYYYAPMNPSFEGPADESPPVVVMSHGGPTGAVGSALNLSIQYWTSRGLAVVDVNYGGSTGYGRDYRERLKGQWGVVDVDDCVNAARFLAERGDADGDRLAIRGGSAGGYTTLCALAFSDAFAAGASYYGVADAAALARDTHKFESRYLDGLIGPYPQAEDLYRSRSAVYHADQISCPLILFQGLEDKVVPPNQAQMMVDALAARGIPYAYLTFEGEDHGFRKSETQKRCLEAEIYFYSQIFGFDLADEVEPVTIENLVSGRT